MSGCLSCVPFQSTANNTLPLSSAIWEHNKIVVTIACGTLLANLAACIYCMFFGVLGCTVVNQSSGVATTRAIWIAPLRICGISNVLRAKFSIIFILCTEVVLLSLMLTGLLRWRSRGKGSIWKLLFSQVKLSWLHVHGYHELRSTTGFGMGCSYHYCGGPPIGAFI